jgi:hypothetical protein
MCRTLHHTLHRLHGATEGLVQLLNRHCTVPHTTPTWGYRGGRAVLEQHIWQKHRLSVTATLTQTISLILRRGHAALQQPVRQLHRVLQPRGLGEPLAGEELRVVELLRVSAGLAWW